MIWRTRWNKIPKIEPPVCPYCGAVAELRDSKAIYGRSYGMAWICANYPQCDAYVGCHTSGKPLGRMADAELRGWKKRAHAAFDPLWRRGKMSRNEAYRWLQTAMVLSKEQAHIGEFDVSQCQRLLELLRGSPPVPPA